MPDPLEIIPFIKIVLSNRCILLVSLFFNQYNAIVN